MTDAYVVGVDMIKFGRFPDRTVPKSARKPPCWPWTTVA
jgi:hypothetical protein